MGFIEAFSIPNVLHSTLNFEKDMKYREPPGQKEWWSSAGQQTAQETLT